MTTDYDNQEVSANNNCEQSVESDRFDLLGTLTKAARFDPPGPTYKKRKHNGQDCAFFDVDEVIQYYDLSPTDIEGVPRVVGGGSGKDFFFVKL